MLCTRCGAPLPESPRFCPDCGAQAVNPTGEPVSTEAVVPVRRKRRWKKVVVLGVFALAALIGRATWAQWVGNRDPQEDRAHGEANAAADDIAVPDGLDKNQTAQFRAIYMGASERCRAHAAAGDVGILDSATLDHANIESEIAITGLDYVAGWNPGPDAENIANGLISEAARRGCRKAFDTFLDAAADDGFDMGPRALPSSLCGIFEAAVGYTNPAMADVLDFDRAHVFVRDAGEPAYRADPVTQYSLTMIALDDGTYFTNVWGPAPDGHAISGGRYGLLDARRATEQEIKEAAHANVTVDRNGCRE